jgi:hypothetical protein
MDDLASCLIFPVPNLWATEPKCCTYFSIEPASSLRGLTSSSHPSYQHKNLSSEITSSLSCVFSFILIDYTLWHKNILQQLPTKNNLFFLYPFPLSTAMLLFPFTARSWKWSPHSPSLLHLHCEQYLWAFCLHWSVESRLVWVLEIHFVNPELTSPSSSHSVRSCLLYSLILEICSAHLRCHTVLAFFISNRQSSTEEDFRCY